MSAKGQKFVRFEDWRSESSSFNVDPYESSCDGLEKTKVKSNLSLASDISANKSASRSNILDPQGPLLQKWNKIFVITCVMAVSVDPLFFYIPMIDYKENCLDMDGALGVNLSQVLLGKTSRQVPILGR